MAISFRPCEPSDVDRAVPLILSSGPSSFNYVFTNRTKKAEDFLSYAFQRTSSASFLIKDFLNIVRFYSWRCIPIITRGLQTERIIAPPLKHEICLAHLAITPELRGKGLGNQLIEHLMNSRSCGAKECYILDVSIENSRAKALYERLGFTTTQINSSSLSNDFGYVADHHRMALSPL